MSDKPGQEIAAVDDLIVAILAGLASAIPRFAEWLFSRSDPIVERVREIMPEKSYSRTVAEQMERRLKGTE